MDSSHVALVSLDLKSDLFDEYKCDHPQSIGINFASLIKILKVSKAGDSVALAADADGDTLTLVFADKKQQRYDTFLLYLYFS